MDIAQNVEGAGGVGDRTLDAGLAARLRDRHGSPTQKHHRRQTRKQFHGSTHTKQSKCFNSHNSSDLR